MGYDPPGLESRPDDTTLAGFGSLMGDANSPAPGFVKTAVMLPGQILRAIARTIIAILKAPFRLFSRSGG